MRRMYYIILCCLPLAAAAQTAGIKHSYAFLSLHQPGNIMVRPDGQPVHAGPDTLLSVYLEVPASASGPIQWKSAWMKGVTFSVEPGGTVQTPLEMGTLKGNRKKVVLTAAKGYRLLGLALRPAEKQPAPVRTIKPGEIILEGKQGGKKILLHVNSVEELESIPSV